MERFWRLAVLACGLGAVLTGCRPPGNPSAVIAPSVTNYTVTGVIRELRSDGTSVVIKHDAIGGYMEAMTMPFDTTNELDLKGLKPFDVVKFQLHVTEDDSWANQFQVLSNAGPTSVSAQEVVMNDPKAVTFIKDVPELQKGDTLPDYVLTNSLGSKIQMADYRGKVLAFNFIFTRCPMPDFCPRLTARFNTAQKMLKERKDAPTDWQMLSITIDPLYDTPRVLTEYGKKHNADPKRWTFATGAYDQLQSLGTHFGLWFSINVTPDNLNHNLRTVVLDRHGKVWEVFVGNEWSSEALANSIVAAGKE